VEEIVAVIFFINPDYRLIRLTSSPLIRNIEGLMYISVIMHIGYWWESQKEGDH
jgi:hypothetical protein